MYGDFYGVNIQHLHSRIFSPTKSGGVCSRLSFLGSKCWDKNHNAQSLLGIPLKACETEGKKVGFGKKKKLSYSAVPAKASVWPYGDSRDLMNLWNCPKLGFGDNWSLHASWSQCFLSISQGSFQGANSCIPGKCSQINKLLLDLTP